MSVCLDTIPEALLFEICNYLDIFDLVSLSEVNKALRSISNSRTSFWLYTLQECSLFLPVASYRPLESFTAAELSLAAHRAALSERNITSPAPKLLSYRYIPWPFEGSPGVPLEDVEWERPEHAIRMHLSHYNGEYMFAVSTNNILRIIHLRSGKVALLWTDDQVAGGFPQDTYPSWAVEFREENEAVMVMNCRLLDGNEEVDGIRVMNVHFKPKECLATAETIAIYNTGGMPSHLDLAGGYVIATIPASGLLPDLGNVLMIRIRDMKEMVLPPLYPSMRIAAFEEYFIAVGVSPQAQIYVQVVGYPQGDNSDTNTSEDQSKPPIALHSYHIPFSGQVFDGTFLFACQICHIYTGSPKSPIKVWLRPGRSGSWSIFSVPFDLKDLRSMASRHLTNRATTSESLVRNLRVNEVDQRVLEERGLVHWAAPTISGRRYIWWRQVENELPPPEPVEESSTVDPPETTGTSEGNEGAISPEDLPFPPVDLETFQFYVSVTDNLASIDEIEAAFPYGVFDFDIDGEYEEGSPISKQLAAVRRMEIPRKLSCRTSRIYMFVMEEWSGTVLVQCFSGDLWVLRYGKA
ncbi:hypothetical protein FRC14_006297 [Serendipita sp. 396]|nr:hypothetical protein FRC14_006297 [Serendipita sp. 396]